MGHITYTTEKAVKKMQATPFYERTLLEEVSVMAWEELFARHSYGGATLKELEKAIGSRLDNCFDVRIPCITGIHGLEYITGGNAHYMGVNDLSSVSIKDFNALVRQASNA